MGDTRYLSWFENYWESCISDYEEIYKPVLISYSTGHLDDIRLSEKYGKDPEKCDNNVEFYML